MYHSEQPLQGNSSISELHVVPLSQTISKNQAHASVLFCLYVSKISVVNCKGKNLGQNIRILSKRITCVFYNCDNFSYKNFY